MDDQERFTKALADRYAIEREIGVGGMATVYLAQDLKHERPVAVKVLDPDLAETLGAKRFLREIKTAANLTHPHILPLHDSGEADGFLYYVMPFVKGESLRTRLTKEKQLPVEDAIQITREIADALAHAHEEGIIHRDVKPANIMLEAGHAVLADFGVAHAVAEAKDERLTRTGTSLGTPAYMSPEQATGERVLDGRSDQYALGCVLYEMLAGHPPFVGAQVEAVVRQHLVADPPPVTQARATVPDEIVKVINRALAKSPADRFKTTGEMAAALALTTTPIQVVSKPFSNPVGIGLAVVAVVTLVALGVLMLKPTSEGPQNPDELVAILPLGNRTDDPLLDGLGRLASYVISDALEWADLTRVLRFDQVHILDEAESGAGGGPTDIRQVWAEVTSATLAIGGDLFEIGDSIQFRLEIRDRSGERLASVPAISVPREDAAQALSDLKVPVVSAVAELVAPRSNLAQVNFESHTPSQEALSLYLKGRLEGMRGGTFTIPYYQSAFQIDPDYLRPAIQLITVYNSISLWQEADSTCSSLQPRIDQMSHLERLDFEAQCARARGDNRTRLQKNRQLYEYFQIAGTNVGFSLLALNRPREAVAAFLDLSDYRGNRLLEAYHLLGEYEDQLATSREFKVRNPDSSIGFLHEVGALAVLGRGAELGPVMEDWISLLGGGSPYFVYNQAALELDRHGHADEARDLWERLITWYETHPSDGGESARTRRRWGRTLLILGDLGEAAPFLETLAAEDPDNPTDQHRLGVLRAMQGGSTEAMRISQLLAEWPAPKTRGRNTVRRARIHANLGDREGAVRLLDQAVVEGYDSWFFLHSDPFLKPLWGYPAFEKFMRPKG